MGNKKWMFGKGFIDASLYENSRSSHTITKKSLISNTLWMSFVQDISFTEKTFMTNKKLLEDASDLHGKNYFCQGVNNCFFENLWICC